MSKHTPRGVTTQSTHTAGGIGHYFDRASARRINTRDASIIACVASHGFDPAKQLHARASQL
jgi:hypothetical protein